MCSAFVVCPPYPTWNLGARGTDASEPHAACCALTNEGTGLELAMWPEVTISRHILRSYIQSRVGEMQSGQNGGVMGTKCLSWGKKPL